MDRRAVNHPQHWYLYQSGLVNLQHVKNLSDNLMFSFLKKKAKRFFPELGQFMFGQSCGGFTLDESNVALFRYMMDEVERVYWNINQEEWSREESPEFDFFVFRPYWWGEDDDVRAEQANFEYKGVRIWWYKHIGRSMSTNTNWSSDQWVKWFNSFMSEIRNLDQKHMDEII